jgi:hypothetical protein
MFIQIIQAKCTRPDDCRAIAERWLKELAPGAEGWLGGTYGFTDDDMFVAVVRFESREAAMANSARPEQGTWWAEMERCLEGPAEFHDCDDVALMMDGGSDDAGFVQIIRGKVDDPERLKTMMTADTETLHEMRPDIIGGTLAFEPDGTFIETIAFTSEDAARRGEQMEMPEERRREMEQMMSEMHDVTYLDLHHPWFASAK